MAEDRNISESGNGLEIEGEKIGSWEVEKRKACSRLRFEAIKKEGETVGRLEGGMKGLRPLEAKKAESSKLKGGSRKTQGLGRKAHLQLTTHNIQLTKSQIRRSLEDSKLKACVGTFRMV
jgi:hypothetical protein